MNLINKIMKAGKSFALAGSVLLAGCAPMTPDELQRAEERMLMLGFDLNALYNENLTPEQRTAFGNTGELIRYELAMGNGNNVEIINLPDKQSVKRYESLEEYWENNMKNSPNKFFTCGYYKGDLNVNGKCDADEFHGYNQNEFCVKEDFSFFSEIHFREGSRIDFALEKENGAQLYKTSFILGDKSHKGTLIALRFTEDIDKGNYKGSWIFKDKVIGEAKIRIK